MVVVLGFLGVEATEENAMRFDKLVKCRRCKPSCCEGTLFEAGALLFPQEVERLATRMGISKRQFKDSYTYTQDSKRFLKLPCPFYKEGCSIYPSRPIVCREFPLNQTYLKNGKMWMTVNMDCPAGRELGERYAVRIQL